MRADDPETEARLKRLRPRVIVVESSRQDFDWRILRGLPPTTMLRVSLDDNVVDVYERFWGTNASPERLVAAIAQSGGRRRAPAHEPRPGGNITPKE